MCVCGWVGECSVNGSEREREEGRKVVYLCLDSLRVWWKV